MAKGDVTTRDIWTHIEAPSSDSIPTLCEKYQLESRFVYDALDRDEIPRFEEVNNTTYIITRFAFETKRGEIKTVPILFALSEQRLVTVSLEPLPEIVEVMPDAKPAIHKSPMRVMLRILLNIDAKYDIFINEIGRKIRGFKQKLGTRDATMDMFIRFVHIEDDLNDFLGSLSPTNHTLKHLRDSGALKNIAKHRLMIDTVILNNEQSITTCENNLKSLDAVRRTYQLINSRQLDRTIKILTLVSVFIAIPTMFFSMYGMNIQLPFMHHGLAFVFIMLICLLIAGGAYYVGRRRNIF